MKRTSPSQLIPLFLLSLALAGCDRRIETRIGSKLDTESVTLSEIAARLIAQDGRAVATPRQLSGTHVAWAALLAGEIDVYPEYTGTIAQEILNGTGVTTEAEMRKALAARGIEMTRPLGFNNTYAIGMRDSEAARLGIRGISDLRDHPDLKLGFSNEFLSRTDGWRSLQKRYRLPQVNARGLEHSLAYSALASGAIDATDLYSTDAEISQYHLRVLRDDLHHFPDYSALYLYRSDWAARLPGAAAALRSVEGKISEQDMMRMNARSKIDGASNTRIAADFLRGTLGIGGAAHDTSMAHNILARTVEHLWLVSVSLLGAILVGLPLGIWAAKSPGAGRIILAAVAVLYTIPGLALLVFLIPQLGIGTKPAVAALFLYSLLPIVRNTYTGLLGISRPLQESAEALGLPAMQRLRRIELPLAASSILAGIKTAAVINIGTATLGALVGAGGYGQPILAGITLRNTSLMLQGAIPAALMALAAQALFGVIERRLLPTDSNEQGDERFETRLESRTEAG